MKKLEKGCPSLEFNNFYELLSKISKRDLKIVRKLNIYYHKKRVRSNLKKQDKLGLRNKWKHITKACIKGSDSKRNKLTQWTLTAASGESSFGCWGGTYSLLTALPDYWQRLAVVRFHIEQDLHAGALLTNLHVTASLANSFTKRNTESLQHVHILEPFEKESNPIGEILKGNLTRDFLGSHVRGFLIWCGTMDLKWWFFCLLSWYHSPFYVCSSRLLLYF